MITINKVSTEEQLRRVCGLRYEIYIEEMDRRQHYADHATRTIHEPLDAYSDIYCAEDDGMVVGTIRTTFAINGPLEYEEAYELERFGIDRKYVSMTTKLVVRPEYRDSLVAGRLAQTVFATNASSGIRLDFIDCNAHLIPFYQRMGYRPYRSTIRHPEYGDVFPMVLTFDDIIFLDEARSPFRRLARQCFGAGPSLGAAALNRAIKQNHCGVLVNAA